MPAMDEFLNAQAEEQVELFEAREVQSIEAGVKAQDGRLAFTVNGFYTKLKNITSQGAIIDTATGGVTWIIETAPETRSYGAEIEVVAFPLAEPRWIPVLPGPPDPAPAFDASVTYSFGGGPLSQP
jgi:outer membrane receptor protein involved in Fe transport